MYCKVLHGLDSPGIYHQYVDQCTFLKLGQLLVKHKHCELKTNNCLLVGLV